MSKLLQRLVQHARSPQRGVEPLLPPFYAPSKTSGQSSWTSPIAADASEIEMAPASAAGPWQSTSAFERLPKNEMAQARIVPRIEVPMQPKPVQSRESAGPARPQIERRTGPYNIENIIDTSTEPLREPLREVSYSTEAEPSQTAAQPERQAPVPADSPSVSRSVPVSGRTKKTVDEQPQMRHSPVTPPRLQQVASKTSLSKQDRLPPQPRSIGEEPFSDVIISIGHIEIRAGQTAPPPRRAAFRPRVSLSDFLNQQNRERV